MAAARSSSAAAAAATCCRARSSRSASSRTPPRPLVRRMLRSWPLEQQRAFFEDEVGVPLKLEAEDGKFFPVSEPRARRARRPDRAGAPTRRGLPIRHATAGPRAGCGGLDRRDVARVGRGSRGHSRHRRPVGAGHRERRRRPGSARAARPHDPPDLSRADAAGLRSAGARRPLRHLARRPTARTLGIARDLEAHGGFLFTHRGYSGPAVLDVSHVAVRSRMAGGDRRGDPRPLVRR